jgi:hypothetical protein
VRGWRIAAITATSINEREASESFFRATSAFYAGEGRMGRGDLGDKEHALQLMTGGP